MTDGQFLSLALILPALPAPLMTMVLHWARPGWAAERVRSISIWPIPVLLAGFAIYIWISTLFWSAKQCGVDICGFRQIGAILLLMLAAGARFTGYLLSLGVSKFMKKP